LNKINLLIIKNPITREVERKQAPYIAGHAPFDYIYPHFMLPENEIEIFCGGKQLTELQMRHTVIRPGDYIVACPKIAGGGDDGKSILMTVASIGLMMVSGFAGNWATAATTGTTSAAVASAGGMAAWNFWGYAAALGVQAAGGYLLNYYAKKNQPETEQGSPTYGWDNVRPLVGQGQPVPVVLGTVKAAGQIIAQHVISEGTRQKLNLLIQCAEGPCDYIGNGEDENCIGIDNIKINNNPLENYTGITVHKRAGLNNQSAIPNFEDTRIEQQIGVELKYDSVWHTFTTTGDTGSGLELTFTMPALFDQEYKGTRRWENEIGLEVQYKLSSNTNWNTKYVTIKGLYLSAFNYVTTINTGVVGQYDVRCRCVYKYAYGDDDAHTIYWSKLSHIVFDDFTYPNKTLLSIQALANEQISGSASVTFELTRSKVWVWVPNDPDLDPWGAGSYQEKPANNPAWGLYWLNHRVYRYWDINANEWVFVVRGASKERMVYNDFKAWADFCDDKGITCNIYFDTIQKLREAMQTLEDIGRGRVLPKGTKIGCMFDGPAQKDANGDIVYSQVFNVANIGLDSFSEQWVDTSERATAIEVTYWNADNNHEKEVMLVPADGLTEGTATGNITQFTIQASVPRAVAWKHCKYKLRLNNYINNTVQITTNVNAIVSDLGQVIGVQHDVPQWGYGGRVVSATTTTITLDKPVVMEADKTYTALFWLNNDTKIEKEIVTEPGETSVLTIAEPFENDTLEAYYVDDNLFGIDGDHSASFEVGQLVHLFYETGDWTDYVISVIYDDDVDMTVVEVLNCPENLESVRFDWTMPHENDQWLFGPIEDGVKKHSRPFKIMGFTRENDLTYRITAVNYEDAVYNESETVPDIDYSSLDPIFEVESLAVKEETFLQLDGTLVSQINASWTLPVGKTADRFLVYYSEDGGLTWFLGVDTIDTKAIITNVKTGVEYLIRVVVFKELIYSAGVTSQPVLIEGKDTPPGDVKSLTVIQQENILKVTVIPPDDSDINRFELRVGGLSWETSSYVKQFKDTQTTIDVTQAGTQTFWAKAIDTSNNYSDNAVSFIALVHPISNKFTIHEETQTADDWEPTGMFKTSNGWQIDSKGKIGDNEFFAQMFESGHVLSDSAEVILDVVDLGETITKTSYAETFLSVFPDFDASNKNHIDIEYRTSWDGTEWSDWLPLINHQFAGRYVQPKLKPRSVDGLTNISLKGATIRIDVTAITETIDFVDVAETGTTRIYLKHRFFNTPLPQLSSYSTTGMLCMHSIGEGFKKDVDGRWYVDVSCWMGETQIAGRIGGSVKGY
jgi:predicted phage tail protein